MIKGNSIALPSAEKIIRQIERLVKIQALAGVDALPLFSQRVDNEICRGEYVIPEFGQLSIMKSIDSLEYAIIDCVVFDDVQDEQPSNGAKYFTITRFPDDASWTLHGSVEDTDRHHIERLTSFVSESPERVFDRLFDVWFYDYPGIVPDDFTLERIQSIYNG